MADKKVLTLSNIHCDDFGDMFSNIKGEIVYDARTKFGSWAIMTENSFRKYGTGKLGLGSGQRYVRTETGLLVKQQ